MATDIVTTPYFNRRTNSTIPSLSPLQVALGKPLQQRPVQTARPVAPILIAPTVSDCPPTTRPRQAGPRVSPAAICPVISAVAGAAGRQKSPSRR